MSRVYLIAASLIALAAPASAAPIRYNDWADSIAQVNFGNEWDFLPVRAHVTGDEQTGHLDFQQWDVYSTDRSLLAYSLPPQSVDLTWEVRGWKGNLDTPDGDWIVILYPRYTAFGNEWRLQVHTELPIHGPYLSDRPNITNFELAVNILQIPEPGSWLLFAGGVLPLLRMRGGLE